MPIAQQRITPFLWYDSQAEEAAKFYTSIFKNSKVLNTARYSKESANASGKPAGTVMTVSFVLDGQEFTAINGGPVFKFNESTSFVVHCDSQEEVDYYWERLSAGGDPKAQQCGWLKDKFGLSWQVIPDKAMALVADPDPDKGRRAMAAILRMKKIDLAEVERAAAAA